MAPVGRTINDDLARRPAPSRPTDPVRETGRCPDARRTVRRPPRGRLTVLALGAARVGGAAPARPRAATPCSSAWTRTPGRASGPPSGRRSTPTRSRPLMAGWRVYDAARAGHPRARRASLPGRRRAADAVQLDAQRAGPRDARRHPLRAYQWALPAIGAPAGWDAAGGAAPVTVAVIDTGVDTSHPDLAGRLWHEPGRDRRQRGRRRRQRLRRRRHRLELPRLEQPGLQRRRRRQPRHPRRRHDRGAPRQRHRRGGGRRQRPHHAAEVPEARAAATPPTRSSRSSTRSPRARRSSTPPGAAPATRRPSATRSTRPATPACCSWPRPATTATDNDAAPMWPANCPAASLVSVGATTSVRRPRLVLQPGRRVRWTSARPARRRSSAPSPGALRLQVGHLDGGAARRRGSRPSCAGLHPASRPWQREGGDLRRAGSVAPALAGATASGRRADLLGALTVAGAGVGPDTTPPDPFGLAGAGRGRRDHRARDPGLPLDARRATPTAAWPAYRLAIDGATVAQVASRRDHRGLARGAAGRGRARLERDRGRRRSATRARPSPRTLLVDRTAAVGARPVGAGGRRRGRRTRGDPAHGRPRPTASAASPATGCSWTASGAGRPAPGERSLRVRAGAGPPHLAGGRRRRGRQRVAERHPQLHRGR